MRKVIIYNETDGVIAHPKKLSRLKAEKWIDAFLHRLKYTQSYYLTNKLQRIPIDQVKFSLIPASKKR